MPSASEVAMEDASPGYSTDRRITRQYLKQRAFNTQEEEQVYPMTASSSASPEADRQAGGAPPYSKASIAQPLRRALRSNQQSGAPEQAVDLEAPSLKGRRRQSGQRGNWQPSSSPERYKDWPDASQDDQPAKATQGDVWEEKWNLGLLVLLYMLQGIPMGLTLGAMPFMLQSRLTYSQIGIFSLAAYPYSFKLLWSPIVDSLYSRRMGRRKTWIIPIQFCTACLLFFGASLVNQLFQEANVGALTVLFFLFVFLAATQDIAVDGWALTLLPPAHVSWASTCQTIGTSSGFFTSFTVFLALQDASFCNTYIRSWGFIQHWFGADPTSTVPMVTLTGYLRFWGVFFAVVTALLWAFKAEGQEFSAEELAARDKLQGHPSGRWASEVAAAYSALWRVVKLKAVWGLTAILLTYRLGVLTAEGAASLKLIEKGVAKETLAALILVQFPVELISAVVAGRWAASQSPAPPFLVSYFLRLAVNAATVGLIAVFPTGATSLALSTTAGKLFVLMAVISLLGSAVSTLAFTALGSLFNTISDPDMGGAYLTLLNTISNMGVILPKAPAFHLIDVLTRVSCVPPAAPTDSTPSAAHLAGLICPRKPSEFSHESACTAAGGMCVVASDGFYTVCWVFLSGGLLLGFVYLRYLPALLRLPLSAWRAPAVPQGSRKD